MRRLQGPLGRYLLAAAALLLATVSRWPLHPLLGENATFPTYFVAVVVVGLYTSLGPALLTLFLGGVLPVTLFHSPVGDPLPSSAEQWVRLTLFYAAGGVILFLAARLRANRRALRESTLQAEARGELLKRITDAVPILFAYVDRDLRYQYVSAGYEAWFQMCPESIAGLHVRDLVGDDAYAYIEPELRRALAGDVIEFERELSFQGAGQRAVRVRFDPIRRRRRLEGLSVVLIDVTERRRLDARAAQLAAIVTAAQEAIITRDRDGVVTEWNAGAERVFGYSEAEMVGAHIDRLAPPERAHENRWLMAEAEAGRSVDEFETVRIRKDGHPIDILLSAAPILDARGRVSALATIERDITQRKQAEAALRANEAQLQAIIDNSPVVLFIKDLEGRYLLANRSYLELFHTTAQELFGRTDWERPFPRDFVEEMRANDRKVIESGKAENFEESTEIDGVLRTYVSTKFPLRDHEGRVYALCGISTDITEQKSQQARLHEADRRKDQFLSMLGHELRNPLTPIVNAAQVLSLDDAGKNERIRWATDVIQRQAAHLTRLVDDLLDIARINSGRIQLRREPVDLGRLVQETSVTAQAGFAERKLKLTVSLPREPLVVSADASRLVQVIDNLLDNACKYTDPGGRVNVELRREEDRAVVRVRDSGIGIDSAELPQLFELFEQADTSLDRARGGLGLGLNLVKRLVEKHGGSVEAHSQGLGAGSEFAFRLPLALTVAGGHSAPEPLPERTLAAGRVLVIEDNQDVAHSLERLLVALGQTVRVAENGTRGIEAAVGFHPQLALVDIGLPDMSGYEAARALRDELGGAIRLVAVTGYGQDEDRARSKTAGFDEHLVKPPSIEALHRVLATIRDEEEPAPRQSMQAPD